LIITNCIPITKKTKISPIKRKRKPTLIKVNHDLSDNSDDNLTYSRRSNNTKARKRQMTSSSFNIL
ncbi:unnamed protein product, partial [Rotaria socialis]